MVLPLLVALLQVATTPADSSVSESAGRVARPVRVWLATSSPLVRGQAVQVYVQAAEDGNLVVLHRRTDGRVEVLFPGDPADDPRVRAGTYEIRGAGDRESFTVAEPDGRGFVLAALSPASYRFDEFVRAASWDPAALVPSWSGADAEGALDDIVQRMLGDGYFNYDVVSYSVAPAVYALQDSALQSPMYPACIGCTFIGFQEIIYEPFSVCDAFFSSCFHPRRFRQREGICGIDSPCLEHTSAIALALGPSSGARVVARATPLALRRDRATSPPIAPRARAPAGRSPREPGVPAHAIPLGPGRQTLRRGEGRTALAARSRRDASTAATLVIAARPAARAPFNQVRLTLSPTSTPSPSEPAAAVAKRGGVELVRASPGEVGRTPGLSRLELRRGVYSEPVQVDGEQRGAGGGGGPVPRSVVTAGSAGRLGGGGESRAMALPGAVWHGAWGRGAVIPANGRRR